jgi:hypothetical protein
VRATREPSAGPDKMKTSGDAPWRCHDLWQQTFWIQPNRAKVALRSRKSGSIPAPIGMIEHGQPSVELPRTRSTIGQSRFAGPHFCYEQCLDGLRSSRAAPSLSESQV